MTEDQVVGLNFRRLRESLQLSQREVAELMKLPDRGTVTEIEWGRRRLTLVEAQKFINVLEKAAQARYELTDLLQELT